MPDDSILSIRRIGFQWETQDPFLFCVHHLDHYPKGNGKLGPAASLAGRNIGNDFTVKDGWRMYHGDKIPGFPVHPHRGFETITFVLQGLVDHADSNGAAGRYGNRDVQWMTAGSGLQHSEMFPLLNEAKENTFELFQIWLNLPANKKFVKPTYKMLWGESIPKKELKNSDSKLTTVDVVAGKLGDAEAPAPAPDSWAADPENEVAVFHIEMEENATFELPAATRNVNRGLYFFEGSQIHINDEPIGVNFSVDLAWDKTVKIKNGNKKARLLFLQGKPIDEPVVQYGPFVMNTQAEIQQAFSDYRRTQFGGWPWPQPDMNHGKDAGRFAKFDDGKTITKD